MIERLLEQFSAIRRVQQNDRKCITVLNWSDKDVLTALNRALKPVSEFTDIMSGENYVTASSIIPVLKLLRDQTLCAVEEDVELTISLKEGILERLEGKYDRALIKELIRMATFMDPRYRGTHFDEEELADVSSRVETEAATLAKEKQALQEEANSRVTSRPPPGGEAAPPLKKRKSLGSLLGQRSAATVRPKTTEERVANELAVYKQEDPLPDTESDPLEWWRMNESRFPLLANLARKYLCICATSTASERVFSTAGNVVTPNRSLLKPAKVDMLVFLAKNL